MGMMLGGMRPLKNMGASEAQRWSGSSTGFRREIDAFPLPVDDGL